MLTYREKRSKEKNGELEKERIKMGKGKWQNGKVKNKNELRTCFLFLLFTKPLNLVLGVQNADFYQEKAFHGGKKRESDLAPSDL